MTLDKITYCLWLGLLAVGASCGKGNGPGGSVTESVPNISIADIGVMESNSATTTIEIEVTLSKTYSKAVTVRYRTVDGTAVGGEDFVAVSEGNLTIAANATTAKIPVTLIGNDIKEGDETFMVRMSNPVNAFMIRETATVTIRNDDTKLSFTNAGYDASTTYPGYTLAWSDEFNGSALNQDVWTYDMGDGCPNVCGWGNNELQYYTNSSENLYFQDGKMIIEAKQQAIGGKNYTSARIKTAGKKAIKFGRVDFRAKVPKGKGIWPAFWMLPQNNVFGNWPRSGELDIMEIVGHEPNKVHGTLHFGPGPGSTQITKSYTLPTGTFADEFHVYSIEWKQDVIRWYVDGQLFSTAEKAAFNGVNYPFNEDFYFLINLAVGGNWPGNPDATTQFPQYLIVDYVRVYQ
jgi:beta-glucanase (GH16 family)